MPVRPDQLDETGIGQLLLQDAEALARLGGRDVEALQLDVDVGELSPDHGEVRQRSLAWRAALERHQVVRVEHRIETIAREREVAPCEEVAVARVVERPRVGLHDSAIHHHEGLGRHLDHSVGVCVDEGEQSLRQQLPVALFLETEAILLELRPVREILGSAEDQVHEAEVAVERQRFGAVHDRLPVRQVGREGRRRALEADADVPSDQLGEPLGGVDS